MDQELKIFIVSGSDENNYIPYCTCKNEHGIEAYIVAAKSEERAMEIVCVRSRFFRFIIKIILIIFYKFCKII